MTLLGAFMFMRLMGLAFKMVLKDVQGEPLKIKCDHVGEAHGTVLGA